uniref:Uncharacterized protein n=1 Tax=Anguilla anguilla TaxID=7936 RepID=A0A0E9RVA7_ANGAN
MYFSTPRSAVSPTLTCLTASSDQKLLSRTKTFCFSPRKFSRA